MKVVFSNRAYVSVLAETTEKIRTETGGLFLGTVKDGTWYIIEAIDPGPKSIFEIAYFEYDQKYTQHLINKIANLYDARLDLIGLWHRHPGSLDQFSYTDDGTNTSYASMRKEGAISALVNVDPSFRITMYHVSSPLRYTTLEYEVGDELIPPELMKLKTPERFTSIMDSMTSSRGRAFATANSEYTLESFMKFIKPSLESAECAYVHTKGLLADEDMQDRLIDELVADLTFLAEEMGIETSIILDDSYLTLYRGRTKLYFMESSLGGHPVLSYDGKCYEYHSGLFAEAYKTARAKKDEGSTPQKKQKKQTVVLDPFSKIIRFNKNEG